MTLLFLTWKDNAIFFANWFFWNSTSKIWEAEACQSCGLATIRTRYVTSLQLNMSNMNYICLIANSASLNNRLSNSKVSEYEFNFPPPKKISSVSSWNSKTQTTDHSILQVHIQYIWNHLLLMIRFYALSYFKVSAI